MIRKTAIILAIIVALYFSAAHRIEQLGKDSNPTGPIIPAAIHDLASPATPHIIGTRYVTTGRVTSTFRVGRMAAVTLSDGSQNITILTTGDLQPPEDGTSVVATFVVAPTVPAGPIIFVKLSSSGWRPVS